LRILFTNHTLDARAGTELYVLDLARHLLRRGHAVSAFSRRLGPVAEELRREGVEVVDDLGALRQAPEVLHGHHHPETMAALLHFPGLPALYVCHGAVPWVERPPLFPRIRRYVAVDLPTRERIAARAGITGERVDLIVEILNFVDLERFRPRAPLPDLPRRALVFSNYASEANFLPAVRAACDARGITCDIAGVSSGAPSDRPEDLLPGYDLVFAKGKAALEALAVGCAVILCDAQGVGPLVTIEDLDRLRRLNFGFRTLTAPHTSEVLAAQIERYDPLAAEAVRRRIREMAGIDPVVVHYERLYAAIVAEQAASRPDPAAEGRAAARYLLGPPAPAAGTGAAALEVDERLAMVEADLGFLQETAAFRMRRWLLASPLRRRIYRWLARPFKR
jgi:glycosyltransferase involved in cell wall biosynthesis